MTLVVVALAQAGVMADEGDGSLASLESARAALAAVPEHGQACQIIAITGAPLAVAHLHDPALQQTAGNATVSIFVKGAVTTRRTGTVVATVVGKQPTGELLTNHHLLLADGTLRTQNDVVSLAPTSDPCVFAATVQVNFHDGTGRFAGLSGTGVSTASLNFCGAPGHAVIYGRLCK